MNSDILYDAGKDLSALDQVELKYLGYGGYDAVRLEAPLL